MDAQSNQTFLLDRRYKVLNKIGTGSFGSIYACQGPFRNEKFAVKIEKKTKQLQCRLHFQIKLYQTFQGIPGIARLHDYGYEGQSMYMVIDLLDCSLQDLFEKHSRKFSIGTVYQIALQCLNRLEAIHRKGFVHRDLKANNFMIGKGQKRNLVHIIDFGLAKKYRDLKTGNHIPLKTGKQLVGTARFASIASHEGYEQGRKDDLESLAYLLLYFLRGKLPWQGISIKKKEDKFIQIGRLKKISSMQELCKPIGAGTDALIKYYQNVRSLSFNQEPKYDFLKKLFREQLVKMNLQNQPLDWMADE